MGRASHVRTCRRGGSAATTSHRLAIRRLKRSVYVAPVRSRGPDWSSIATTPGNHSGIRGPSTCAANTSVRGAAISAVNRTSPTTSQVRQLERPEPQQRDQALAVAALADQVVEPLERLAHDLDALLFLGVERIVGQVGRQVGVDLLVREPGARVETGQEPPAGGRLADFLAQLALCGLERLAAVQLPGGQLEQALLADRLAGLAHEPDPLSVPGQHHHGAGMLHHFTFRHLAVVVAKPLDLHGADVALPDLLLSDLLEAQPAPPFASAAPPARPARKNSRSSAAERPMVVAGSPLCTYSSSRAATSTSIAR